MKILKIFGIVVGIHLFALILIFANPGCSSTTKPSPKPGDTAATGSSPVVAAPSASTAPATTQPGSSAITFNPDTPAAAAPASTDTGGVRFTPTRPGTPVAGALVAEPVVDVTPATSYTVKSGDSLWTIARKNNITVAQLASANSISANASLRPGQKLIIPGKPASPSAAATASGGAGPTPKATTPATAAALNHAGSDVVKHVVKSGETLGAIARKYDVRQGDLAVANNISDPARIRPGMELIIPGWQSTGSKAGKSSKSGNGTKAPPPSAPTTVELLPSEPPPANPAPVPVIRIDDNPAPATKQP